MYLCRCTCLEFEGVNQTDHVLILCASWYIQCSAVGLTTAGLRLMHPHSIHELMGPYTIVVTWPAVWQPLSCPTTLHCRRPSRSCGSCSMSDAKNAEETQQAHPE
jgi:hypothetical protein